MGALTLRLLDETFSIYRFNASDEIPHKVLQSSFYNISKTDEELSIICPGSLKLNDKPFEADWSCIKVTGPLDFNETGILASLSGILTEARISIFAVSTFDTDYILVKSVNIKKAINALEAAGYKFIEP